MTEIELMEYIGDSISYELKECGITRQELAYETGISEPTICRYINGKIMPTLKNLIKIAWALDCELTDLIDISEPIK